MKAMLGLLAILTLATPAAFAGEPVTKTMSAPIDRVWNVTLSVLKQLDWDIDKEDRSIGWITTDSRRLEGEDYGVYAKALRHRLTVRMKSAGNNRTTVTIERTVFKRERIMWVDNDEPIGTTDRSVETKVLDAIEKAL